MYLPVRVSTLIFSPVLMKSGAWTVMPVSSVIAFCTLLAESPRMPSGASVTFRHDAGRQFNRNGFVFDEGHGDLRVFHQVILRVADDFRRRCVTVS